jgi:hypothetical protein
MARDIMKLYREKRCSAEEAMSAIRPGFWIDYGFFNGKPQLCDRALAARKADLSDVSILAAVTLPPVPEVLSCDPKGEVFTYNDFHFSPLSRILQSQTQNVFYNPILGVRALLLRPHKRSGKRRNSAAQRLHCTDLPHGRTRLFQFRSAQFIDIHIPHPYRCGRRRNEFKPSLLPGRPKRENTHIADNTCGRG